MTLSKILMRLTNLDKDPKLTIKLDSQLRARLNIPLSFTEWFYASQPCNYNVDNHN
jgi:hypothetical protein